MHKLNFLSKLSKSPLSDYNYMNSEVEFTEKVAYYCFNGMKSQSNFDFTFQEATCNTGNIWTSPSTWEQCTDSK
jgi:hypothetical protein